MVNGAGQPRAGGHRNSFKPGAAILPSSHRAVYVGAASHDEHLSVAKARAVDGVGQVVHEVSAIGVGQEIFSSRALDRVIQAQEVAKLVGQDFGRSFWRGQVGAWAAARGAHEDTVGKGAVAPTARNARGIALRLDRKPVSADMFEAPCEDDESEGAGEPVLGGGPCGAMDLVDRCLLSVGKADNSWAHRQRCRCLGASKWLNPVREPLPPCAARPPCAADRPDRAVWAPNLRAEKSVSTRRRRLPYGGLAKVAFSSASHRSRRCHRVAGAEGTRDEAQESPLAGASL